MNAPDPTRYARPRATTIAGPKLAPTTICHDYISTIYNTTLGCKVQYTVTSYFLLVQHIWTDDCPQKLIREWHLSKPAVCCCTQDNTGSVLCSKTQSDLSAKNNYVEEKQTSTWQTAERERLGVMAADWSRVRRAPRLDQNRFELVRRGCGRLGSVHRARNARAATRMFTSYRFRFLRFSGTLNCKPYS